MWKGNAAHLSFRPEEGLEVVAEGKLSTFPGQSRYQLIADRMAPAGVGALLAQLERLKAKLAAEGLFDAARKKPIPFLPRVIGVVTSPTGAVIRDILHRLSERFGVRVLLWPTLVQGEKAAAQVAAAVAGFDALAPDGSIPRPDVLIVARGGGSIEDLWAFNDERVARAVAACSIPVISAVGHETDTTLIDFVSDLRAPTPTGAAEKAVPVRAELLAQVQGLEARLTRAIGRTFETDRTRLRAAAARLPRVETLFAPQSQRLDLADARLAPALRALAARAQNRLTGASARLTPRLLAAEAERRRVRLGDLSRRLSLRSPEAGIAAARQRVDALAARLPPAATRQLTAWRRQVEANGRQLEALSHRATLARGYGLVRRVSDGALLRSVEGVAAGEALSVTLADGSLDVRVEGDGAAAPAPRSAPRTVRAPPGGDQGRLF
jgi:exodeoxyribonuclease VII large subunit